MHGCLRSCVNLANYACDGVLWKARDSTCYRKVRIVVGKCMTDWGFDLYVRTDPYYPQPPTPPAPPSPPPVPPHLPLPPAPPSSLLSHATCQKLWAEPTSRFHDLWGTEGWKVRGKANRPCWGKSAEEGFQYFDDAWWGKACEGRNWYTGTEGELGDAERLGPADETVRPHFTKLAPALLGFDETIDQYCAAHGGRRGQGHSEACVHANVNILSLYGKLVPYNTCRNVEWQLCAAKGTLPGQAGGWAEGADGRIREGANIRFAYAPRKLDPVGGAKPLGNCGGYMPAGCGTRGYASSDSAPHTPPSPPYTPAPAHSPHPTPP